MDEKIQKCKEQLDTYYDLFLQSLDNLAKTVIKTKIDFEQLKACDNFNKINDRYKLSETILNVYNGQKSIYEKMMNLKAEYEPKIKNLHTDNADSENTFSQDKPVEDSIEPENIEDNIEPENIENNIEEHNEELDTEETKCENMSDLDETPEESEKDTEIDCEDNQTVKTEESSSVKKRGRPRKVS